MDRRRQTGVHVILEYPATPDQTLALANAFAEAGITARLRAAPRRRTAESPVWRIVIATPLHEFLHRLDAPRAALPHTLERLVGRVANAWNGGPTGHIEVGPRTPRRRATGGVLLTPDLPHAAYAKLVQLATETLDPDRLFLWDVDASAWSTFDAGPTLTVASADERGADLPGEVSQGRFSRAD